MSKVIPLIDNGLSPALRHAVEDMQSGIWAAIDKAAEAGMPVGLIVGQLEFTKAALIDHHFQKIKTEAE